MYYKHTAGPHERSSFSTASDAACSRRVTARVMTNKAATAAGTAVIIWLQSQSDLQSVPAVVSHRARELAARRIFLNTAVQA